MQNSIQSCTLLSMYWIFQHLLFKLRKIASEKTPLSGQVLRPWMGPLRAFSLDIHICILNQFFFLISAYANIPNEPKDPMAEQNRHLKSQLSGLRSKLTSLKKKNEKYAAENKRLKENSKNMLMQIMGLTGVMPIYLI